MNAGAAALGVSLVLATGCAATSGGQRGAKPTKATSSTGIYSTEPDPVTGARWVKPLIADRPGTGYYFYFAVDGDQKKGAMRAVFETLSDRWLLAERVVVRVDGVVFDVPIPTREWRRGWVKPSEPGARAVLCAERADVPLGVTHPEIVAAMCTGSRVVVRLVGQDALTIDPQNAVFPASLKAVCDAYGPPPRAPKGQPGAQASGARSER